jgi:hypothetical protein
MLMYFVGVRRLLEGTRHSPKLLDGRNKWIVGCDACMAVARFFLSLLLLSTEEDDIVDTSGANFDLKMIGENRILTYS